MDTNEESFNAKLEPIHIATALIALKSRHRLSNTCINDILVLLKSLGIDVPSSYKALCSLLKKRSNSHISPSTYTICPHCGQSSTDTYRCTACGVKYSPIPTSDIPLFYNYDILPQLAAVIATSKDLVLAKKGDLNEMEMKDITDGQMYKKLLEKESDSFVTLTMNVDGIQPNKGSDQSIWPVLLIINEIKRKQRYSLENTIIAGIWPGPSKPSRTQMSVFLTKIVSELQDLEKGNLFEVYSPEHAHHAKFIKVFLIAACCDKPAQCLVQCLPEPTAFFGCGHCELEGE